MREKHLQTPTEPIEIEPGMTTDELLKRMEKISFQGRQLARAARVWETGLRAGAYVMMGIAGAMVPAGMRKLFSLLIEKHYVHCLVSTGANLFHDLYETIGKYHYIGTPQADDVELYKQGIDRIYDTYADEREFEKLDAWIASWAEANLEDRPYSTREFLHELGREAESRGGSKNPGILSTAYKHNVPIYCPAIADSSIGIGLASGKKQFVFDVVQDVRESADLVIGRDTMVIYCGGGTPKNFIQQTEVTSKLVDRLTDGHKYAVQFITDAPHWGGLSGCTFDEAVSWGKINPKGERLTVFCDATIALPIVVSVLATRMGRGST